MIDNLILERCPKGVPYHKLADVLLRKKGAPVTAESMRLLPTGDRSVRVFAGGRTYVDVDSAALDKKFIISGPAIIVKSRGIIEFVFWDGAFSHKNELWSYLSESQDLDLKFAFYVLRSKTQEFITLAKSKSVKMPQLATPDTDDYRIPVPPLEVQREIVSILDRFTQLEAQLEAELEARSSQFQYFCDRAYDLGDSQSSGHKISTLGEQGSLTKGSGLQKSDFRDEGEPCIHYGQIHTKFGSVVDENLTFIDKALFSKLRKATYGNLVIADTAEDLAGVARGIAWIGAQEVAVGGHALIYDHGFDPMYIAYFLRSHSFQAQKNKLAKGVKVKDISGKALGKIAVPVPNIDKQRSIGRQLADLDNLVKDASIGLPAEIAARRKQYEYYRNKLLTFKELESE